MLQLNLKGYRSKQSSGIMIGRALAGAPATSFAFSSYVVHPGLVSTGTTSPNA